MNGRMDVHTDGRTDKLEGLGICTNGLDGLDGRTDRESTDE